MRYSNGGYIGSGVYPNQYGDIDGIWKYYTDITRAIRDNNWYVSTVPANVVVSPSNVVEAVGNSVSLLCSYTNDTYGFQEVFSWEKSLNGIDWASINHSGNNYSFILSNTDDNTYYRCKVYRGLKNSTSNSVSVSIATIETPSSPLSLSATAGDTSAYISWSTPSSSGGAPISDYIIQYSINNGTSWTTYNDGITTNTYSSINGLTNGISYIFRVAAVNDGGTGPFSDSSNSIVPDSTPIITLITQPLNDRVLSSSEDGMFVTSGIISNNSTPIYQWQIYSDFDYQGINWYNIANSNNPILNISYNTLNNNNFYIPYNGSGYMVRSILSYPNAVSVTGRHAHLLNIVNQHSFYESLYDDYSTLNYLGVNNNFQYYSISNNSTLYLYLEDYAYEASIESWYTGNTYIGYFEESLDGTNWNTIQAFSGNYYYELTTTASNTTKYYRTRILDLWPYNIIDGSISRSEASYYYTTNQYKIDWI